jgi:hypothetical protein
VWLFLRRALTFATGYGRLWIVFEDNYFYVWTKLLENSLDSPFLRNIGLESSIASQRRIRLQEVGWLGTGSFEPSSLFVKLMIVS